MQTPRSEIIRVAVAQHLKVSAEMTELTPAMSMGLGALAMVIAGVCGFLLATYLTKRR